MEVWCKNRKYLYVRLRMNYSILSVVSYHKPKIVDITASGKNFATCRKIPC